MTRSPAAGHLTLAEAKDWLASSAFTTAVPGRVGVEIEFVTRDSNGAPPADELLGALDRSVLPAGGRITEEPGGQLEVSTRTSSGLVDAVSTTASDVAELSYRAANAGIVLLGEGTDPLFLPPLRTVQPRYRAMESYLDQSGPNGRRMMRATASLQVTVESDAAAGAKRRWQLLHAMGPALVAAFANSPFIEGRDTGWASARQGIWLSLDPALTGPVLGRQSTAEPVDAYVRYALGAPVMMVAGSGHLDTGSWAVETRFTFAEWIKDHKSLQQRPPTLTDLKYHLTTLFPPVRPRGAVEVRYLDAQRGAGWVVPLAVLFTLVEDPDVCDRALDLTAATAGRWWDAARLGLADPDLAAVASGLLDLATESLDRRSEPRWIVDRVARFAHDYTSAGRCPADDLRAVGPGAAPEPHPAIDAPIPTPVGIRA